MEIKSKEGQCRFCLETDLIGNLISPCLCKGSFQYVHNTCLMKWYNFASDKALKCNVCLEEYEKDYDIILEDIHPTNQIVVRFMQKPIAYILITHGSFLGLGVFFQNSYLYYLFYLLFHFIHNYLFYRLLDNVKNRGLYRAYWISSSRFFIPVCIILVFSSLSVTRHLGTVTVDLLMYMGLHEHYEILSKINSRQRFFFKDRSKCI